MCIVIYRGLDSRKCGAYRRLAYVESMRAIDRAKLLRVNDTGMTKTPWERRENTRRKTYCTSSGKHNVSLGWLCIVLAAAFRFLTATTIASWGGEPTPEAGKLAPGST